jgi:hypothetical protein
MKYWLIAVVICCVQVCAQPPRGNVRPLAGEPAVGYVTISQERLYDKIKGGWAGQTIGVTYGGPVEFRFCGTFIQDYQRLDWSDTSLRHAMVYQPGLYDDIYMDLTFVDVLDRAGLDAPVDSFAQAFAHAGYDLWHANQAARYNILHGIEPPLSGHWLHSPHADDIDYQIESDFAGLMHPGMPNSASLMSDKVGHIMNYGDGWYGGVYIGAMYSLAFVSDDISYIVKEALKTIPAQSEFYRCMSDVIRWHAQWPEDWKETWLRLQEKWSQDIGCPDGVFAAFDIDAKINAAYVLMGLLYGNKDFTKTLEIAARCGQDADCNPSSAGGILGAVLGYGGIPERWKKGLKDIEDMNFKYTRLSLNKVYAISYKHALAMIRRNGGSVDSQRVSIKVQAPSPVRMEKSFEGVFPVDKKEMNQEISPETAFDFEGTGFVLRGGAEKRDNHLPEYVFRAEIYVDDVKTETAEFPTAFHDRRHELFWQYRLSQGKHRVKVVVLNPSADAVLRTWDYIIYNTK